MAPSIVPRYPVYVISKGRADRGLTANFLLKDKTPFHLVIEPQEKDDYLKYYDESILKILPFSNLGQGSIPARNWVWQDSMDRGFEAHWILDDNIRLMRRRWKERRIPCNSRNALFAVEDFFDRYENLAIAGLNYESFIRSTAKIPPFYLNNHVYSCLLIRNDVPYRWRGRYNEDTDLCLQVLSGGWCTVLVNAFMISKNQTMKMKGGNSDQLYVGNGRLKMAESLARQWPGVVTVQRRFGRPQHVVKNNWRDFTTPLKRKPGVSIPKTRNEYGLALVKVADG